MRRSRKYDWPVTRLVKRLRLSPKEAAGYILKRGESLVWPSHIINKYGEAVDILPMAFDSNRSNISRWMLRDLRASNSLSRKKLAAMFLPYGVDEKKLVHWLRPGKADNDLLPFDIVFLMKIGRDNNLEYKHIFDDPRLGTQSVMDTYWR